MKPPNKSAVQLQGRNSTGTSFGISPIRLSPIIHETPPQRFSECRTRVEKKSILISKNSVEPISSTSRKTSKKCLAKKRNISSSDDLLIEQVLNCELNPGKKVKFEIVDKKLIKRSTSIT